MTAKTLCVLDGIAYSANDLRQIIAERNEAVAQLTSRLKQSHELRRALDALELHRIPELESEIKKLRKLRQEAETS